MLVRHAWAYNSSCSQVVLVYLQPFQCNSLLKCMWQLVITKNSLKPPTLGVQSHSRSSMLTPLSNLSPVLVMISSISVPNCNHFYAKQANSAKITSFWGVPIFLLVQEDSRTQWHKILSWNTRDSKLSCGENPKFLSHLLLDQYRIVTDGQTNGQKYHADS